MMKRKIIAAALVAVLAFPAHAQLAMTGAGKTGSAAPPGYTGALDIVGSAFGCWSLRACSAAYAASGGSAILACTAGDALCTTIHVTSTGGLSAADITTSTCASVTCTIKQWYDQTGNGRTASEYFGGRATLNLTGLSGLPTADFNGTSSCYSTGSLAVSQPLTISANAIRTGSFTTDQTIAGSTSIKLNYGYFNMANFLGGNAGANSHLTANDSVWHSVNGVYNGASGILNGDTTTLTAQNMGTNNLSGSNFLIGCGTGFLVGSITETVVWPSAITTTNITAINSNRHTYWSF